MKSKNNNMKSKNNPRIGNPRIGNPRIGNPSIRNQEYGNPRIGNPRIGNPRIMHRGGARRGPRACQPGRARAPALLPGYQDPFILLVNVVVVGEKS